MTWRISDITRLQSRDYAIAGLVQIWGAELRSSEAEAAQGAGGGAGRRPARRGGAVKPPDGLLAAPPLGHLSLVWLPPTLASSKCLCQFQVRHAPDASE